MRELISPCTTCANWSSSAQIINSHKPARCEINSRMYARLAQAEINSCNNCIWWCFNLRSLDFASCGNWFRSVQSARIISHTHAAKIEYLCTVKSILSSRRRVKFDCAMRWLPELIKYTLWNHFGGGGGEGGEKGNEVGDWQEYLIGFHSCEKRSILHLPVKNSIFALSLLHPLHFLYILYLQMGKCNWDFYFLCFCNQQALLEKGNGRGKRKRKRKKPLTTEFI